MPSTILDAEGTSMKLQKSLSTRSLQSRDFHISTYPVGFGTSSTFLSHRGKDLKHPSSHSFISNSLLLLFQYNGLKGWACVPCPCYIQCLKQCLNNRRYTINTCQVNKYLKSLLLLDDAPS